MCWMGSVLIGARWSVSDATTVVWCVLIGCHRGIVCVWDACCVCIYLFLISWMNFSLELSDYWAFSMVHAARKLQSVVVRITANSLATEKKHFSILLKTIRAYWLKRQIVTTSFIKNNLLLKRVFSHGVTTVFTYPFYHAKLQILPKTTQFNPRSHSLYLLANRPSFTLQSCVIRVKYGSVSRFIPSSSGSTSLPNFLLWIRLDCWIIIYNGNK